MFQVHESRWGRGALLSTPALGQRQLLSPERCSSGEQPSGHWSGGLGPPPGVACPPLFTSERNQLQWRVSPRKEGIVSCTYLSTASFPGLLLPPVGAAARCRQSFCGQDPASPTAGCTSYFPTSKKLTLPWEVP